MSEAKFTKGVWEMSLDIGGKTLVHSEGETICGGIDCKHQGGNVDIYNVEAEANAHLIIAAPDMYEMLERLSELMPFLDEQTHPQIECDALKYDIDKLLAIARGDF